MDRSMLTAMLVPVVKPLGLEVDRIDVLSAGKRKLVRVRLDGDGPTGTGPDLDQIAAATKVISTALDNADMGNQPYVLEVSSRGVDAPLTSPAHFRRNRGRLVHVSLTCGGSWIGRIIASDDKTVTIVPDGHEPVVVAFENINKAVVQVEFNRSNTEDEAE
ncbi:MAG: ribosome maturation factor RimP [Propionibacteriaceae bacterium]|nr:ribosome maturation factor RimP [Propionibacteriaceae bacterium]